MTNLSVSMPRYLLGGGAACWFSKQKELLWELVLEGSWKMFLVHNDSIIMPPSYDTRSCDHNYVALHTQFLSASSWFLQWWSVLIIECDSTLYGGMIEKIKPSYTRRENFKFCIFFKNWFRVAKLLTIWLSAILQGAIIGPRFCCHSDLTYGRTFKLKCTFLHCHLLWTLLKGVMWLWVALCSCFENWQFSGACYTVI